MAGLSRGGLWHPSVPAHTWRPLDCSSSSQWLPVINPGMGAGRGESLCSRCWQSLSVALRANLAADMPSPVSCYSSIPDPVLPDNLRLLQSTRSVSISPSRSFFFSSAFYSGLWFVFVFPSLACAPPSCSLLDCFFSSRFTWADLVPPPPPFPNAWAAPGLPAFAARLHGGNKQWAYC